jgi:glycosyltransferase involved in cell wall biosynthesis
MSMPLPYPVYMVHHQPKVFASRSGFIQLIEQLQAVPLDFEFHWGLFQKSWTLYHRCKQWGERYYGSEWNALVPYWDEWKLARQIRHDEGAIVHFIWAEFSSPRRTRLFQRRGNRLVGTFHCSISRLPKVLAGFRCWDAYQALAVTSRTQLPFFIDQGIPDHRIRVIPLGVDTDYFRPDPAWCGPASGPLRAILVGKTERDHEFTAAVMRKVPPGRVCLNVCTHRDYHRIYQDVPGVVILPHLSDAELLRLYQSAELMIMPFLDCTSNDALLEAMACGTPVMTNRIGGIPEYVEPSCNVLMDDKRVDDWVDRLGALSDDRPALWSMREPVRRWSERFAWTTVVQQYWDMYRDAFRAGPAG